MISNKDEIFTKSVADVISEKIKYVFSEKNSSIDWSLIDQGIFSVSFQYKNTEIKVSAMREYSLMKLDKNPWVLAYQVSNPSYDETIKEQIYSGQTVRDIRTEPLIDILNIVSDDFEEKLKHNGFIGENDIAIQNNLLLIKKYFDEK